MFTVYKTLPTFKDSGSIIHNDLKEYRIRANVISFGATESSMNRLGTLDEIAKAILFLVSDDNSYINAIELFVDGSAGKI